MSKNQEIALYLIFIFFSTFWIFYTYDIQCWIFYTLDIILILGMGFISMFITENLEGGTCQ